MSRFSPKNGKLRKNQFVAHNLKPIRLRVNNYFATLIENERSFFLCELYDFSKTAFFFVIIAVIANTFKSKGRAI